jgi:hypothetical protein
VIVAANPSEQGIDARPPESMPVGTAAAGI